MGPSDGKKLGCSLASQTVYKTDQYKLTIYKISIENSQDL